MKNNVKRIRLSKGLSQQEVANILETGRGQISKLENGKLRLTDTWITRLSAALSCEPIDLIGGSVQNVVPLVGYVGASAEIFPTDDRAMGNGLRNVESLYMHTSESRLAENDLSFVEAPKGESLKKTVAVRVQGHSMYPAYQDGDLIYYHRGGNFHESFLRKECVVKLADGRVLIKIIIKGSSPKTFTLNSYNTPPIEDVKIEWASPVLWVKKAL